jgi:hypothetical protein
MDKDLIINHYNKLACQINKWKKRNKFYHNEIIRYYKFMVIPNSSILELGCRDGDLLSSLVLLGE